MASKGAAPLQVDTTDLLRAQGLALALIGGLLEGGGVVAKREFSRLLGMLGAITADSDSAQGDILGVWSAMASAQT